MDLTLSFQPTIVEVSRLIHLQGTWFMTSRAAKLAVSWAGLVWGWSVPLVFGPTCCRGKSTGLLNSVSGGCRNKTTDTSRIFAKSLQHLSNWCLMSCSEKCVLFTNLFPLLKNNTVRKKRWAGTTKWRFEKRAFSVFFQGDLHLVSPR